MTNWVCRWRQISAVIRFLPDVRPPGRTSKDGRSSLSSLICGQTSDPLQIILYNSHYQKQSQMGKSASHIFHRVLGHKHRSPSNTFLVNLFVSPIVTMSFVHYVQVVAEHLPQTYHTKTKVSNVPLIIFPISKSVYVQNPAYIHFSSRHPLLIFPSFISTSLVETPLITP